MAAVLSATPVSTPTVAPHTDIGDAVVGVGNIAEIMNKYGIAVTILALFCICFIIMIIAILANNKKLINMIANNNQSNEKVTLEAVKELVRECVKDTKQDLKDVIDETNKEEEDSHKGIVNGYVNASIAFKDAARIAMNKIRCQRIAIYLFHNGNKTPFGFPFAKMSCVYEQSTKNTTTIRGHEHSNVPLYAFSSIVDKLAEDNEYVVDDISAHVLVNSDQQLLDFIAGSNTKSFFALAIRDPDGCLAAFTIAEFKDPHDFSVQENYNKIKEALKTMNDNIYSIVINDEYKKGLSNNNNSEG